MTAVILGDCHTDPSTWNVLSKDLSMAADLIIQVSAQIVAVITEAISASTPTSPDPRASQPALPSSFDLLLFS